MRGDHHPAADPENSSGLVNMLPSTSSSGDVVAGTTRDLAKGRLASSGGGSGEEPRQEAISVVVCAYSEARWGDLCTTVDSLGRQSHRPLEVVLVVDHCAPLASRAATTFATASDPPVRIVENPHSAGLSNARNCGWRAAKGSIVAFIDDDAFAEREWLESLLVHYHSWRTAGVGGRVEPKWVSGRPPWFPPEFDWVVGCSHSGMPSVTTPVRNLVGTNMSFRRVVLEDLEGFSPMLGRVGANAAGCEETSLCIRAARDGSALVYEPGAAVYHSVPSSRTTWRYFVRRCYGEGRSKARMTALTGGSAALGEERMYLRATIPKGIVNGLRRKGAQGAVGMVLAMVLGVGATALGYAMGTVERTPLREVWADGRRGVRRAPGDLHAAGPLRPSESRQSVLGRYEALSVIASGARAALPGDGHSNTPRRARGDP